MIRALAINVFYFHALERSMPSFTTIFRAAVMLAVGAIVFKGWQMYGPPAEQVKSIAARALDMGQAAWKSFQTPDPEAHPLAQSQAVAPSFSQASPLPRGDSTIVPPALSSPTLTPSPMAEAIPSTSAPAASAVIIPLAETAAPSGSTDERVKALISRLEQLGGADPKVVSWGSGGHLFRCCCQAPLANSSAVMQHFESIAAEPALAVEQVVAKVEASRTAQRSAGVLRY